MNEASLSNLTAVGVTIAVVWAILTSIRVDVRLLVSGRNVVLVGIGAWFLLEALMLPAELDKYTQEEYSLGVLAVAAAAAAFLTGYHKTPGCPLFPRLGAMVRNLDDSNALWKVVVIGAAVGFAPILYFGGTDLIKQFQSMLGMRKSWGGVLARGRYGDARAALLQLEMFVTGVGPFAAVLLLDRRTPLARRVFCLMVMVWPVFRAYGSGTRSFMITSVMPVLAIFYFRCSPRTQRRMIVGGLALAPLVYQFMAAIVVSRGQGELDWESGTKATYVGNEMFRELLFIQRNVPAKADYQYGYIYYVQMVNPIPRFLWEGKPALDAGLMMAAMYGAGEGAEATLTIAPGLIGEMYFNFGWVGVVGLSFFGGWLVRGWDRIAEENPDSVPTMVYYAGGLAVLFIMGRAFNLSQFYGLMSFAALAWVVRPRPGSGVTS